MSVFAEKLGKIEDSLSRKQLYNIMYDMLKTQDLSGAQLVNICKQNLVEETEPDVIADLLGGRNSIVQGTIKAYIPLEVFEKYNHDIFEMLLAMLAKDSIKDKSTQHLVMDGLISCAVKESDIEMLINWFNTGFVHDI